jgi:hypothetical protein
MLVFEVTLNTHDKLTPSVNHFSLDLKPINQSTSPLSQMS